MAERKIEIQMATVGAAEAAAGVRQGTDAVKDLTNATDQHAKKTEAAATEGKQDTQIQLARAEVFSQVASAMSIASTKIKELGDKARETNPELAELTDDVSEGMNSVAGAAQAAAMGFAVAGPAGGAVAATFTLMTQQLQKLVEAYLDLQAGQNERRESTENLAIAEENHARHHDEMVARRKAAGFKKLLEEQTEAARNLSIEMEALAKVEAASGKLDTAKKDRRDFDRLQAGEDPETVRADRALWDEAQAKLKIDADLERRKAAMQRATQIAETADQDATAAENAPGLEPEQVAKRRQAAKAAKAAADEAARAYDEAQTLGGIEKAVLGESAATAVAKEQAALQARRQREAEEQNRRDAEQHAKAVAFLAAQEAEDARGGLDSSSRAAAGKFGEASGRAPSRAIGTALGEIGNSLADGANAAEIQKLQQQFSKATAGLGGATVAALKNMLAELDAQAKKIAEIDARTKASRPIGG
jgi:antirestriction protein